MGSRLSWVVAWGGLACTACIEAPRTKLEPGTPVEPAARLSRTIGPAGGSLVLGPVSLVVPEGALAAPVELSIARANENVAAEYVAYSPVYVFEPAGTTFSLPAQLTISLDHWVIGAELFWSEDGRHYDTVAGGTGGDGWVSAPVRHFSRGFGGVRVATRDAGPNCPALCDSQRGDGDCVKCSGSPVCFVDPYGSATRFGTCVASAPTCPATCDSIRGDQDCAACAPGSICLADTYGPAGRFGTCVVPLCPSTCDSNRGDLDCAACPNARRCVIMTYGPNRFGACK